VTLYGEAPSVISGVMQLNVQIPAHVLPGNLPISIIVGGLSSPNGVTVSAGMMPYCLISSPGLIGN
jgi:uncharacterized protein (TIGR03437 family)